MLRRRYNPFSPGPPTPFPLTNPSYAHPLSPIPATTSLLLTTHSPLPFLVPAATSSPSNTTSSVSTSPTHYESPPSQTGSDSSVRASARNPVLQNAGRGSCRSSTL